MNIRVLTDADYYNILCKWWKDWGWDNPPDLDLLSDDGIIIFDGDEPVCAGFLYLSNSKMCYISWIVSSKTYRKKPNRKEYIKVLIDTLSRIGKDLGYTYCYINFDNKNLTHSCEELGFNKGGVTQEMIKVWEKKAQEQDQH